MSGKLYKTQQQYQPSIILTEEVPMFENTGKRKNPYLTAVKLLAFIGAIITLIVAISLTGCGGGGTEKPDDPITCDAPFILNNAGTACICPSGTHQDGDTCVPNTVADTIPPVVNLTAPVNSANVSNTVNVVATVTDNIGVADVSLTLDGSLVGNSFTESPAHVYTTNVDTKSLLNGSHTIKVCATDTSANSSCSSTVSVTVQNEPTCPAGQYWNGTVCVLNSTDTVPPTGAIMGPIGQYPPVNLTGKVLVKIAAADDNSGVAKVEMYLRWMGGDKTLPATYNAGLYEVIWDTTIANVNTEFTVGANVWDKAGNLTRVPPGYGSNVNNPDGITLTTPTNLVGTVIASSRGEPYRAVKLTWTNNCTGNMYRYYFTSTSFPWQASPTIATGTGRTELIIDQFVTTDDYANISIMCGHMIGTAPNIVYYWNPTYASVTVNP